jgi:hypothetical protein
MSYLQQLVEQQPLAERYPPHARPIDREPWRGHEHRIAKLYGIARELAEMLRPSRGATVRDPDTERGRAMFLHYHARLTALFESWDPKGPAH